MRVALIQPASPFLLDQGVHGPLGLWYLGAALREAGHDPLYVDLGLGDALVQQEGGRGLNQGDSHTPCSCSHTR